jgi:hypothetical protein
MNKSTLLGKAALQARRMVLLMGIALLPCSMWGETNENKLIRLRDKMPAAKTTAEQEAILKEVGTTGTFTAMMYAAQYLDTPALRKAAAQAVASIATSHIEYNGANTRALLQKSLKLVKGDLKKKVKAYLTIMPQSEEGYVSLFNGKDLTGWKGLVENPIARMKMSADELARKQVKADEQMRKDWKVIDGLLTYVGTGFDNICTTGQYGNFEMLVDWKLDPSGKEPDAGIYLRGTPQVQIWDIKRVDVGAQVGSGGLYNNKKNESRPSQVADNKTGEWNSFYIKMVNDRVTVVLNGVKVVDNIIMENYWDRSRPIFPVEQLELQAHGSRVYYRDIYVKRL